MARENLSAKAESGEVTSRAPIRLPRVFPMAFAKVFRALNRPFYIEAKNGVCPKGWTKTTKQIGGRLKEVCEWRGG